MTDQDFAPHDTAALRDLLARVSEDMLTAAPVEPIRAIHHLACTGGTLISRAIAAMPNVTLLSEIDPLSTLDATPAGAAEPFRPLDLLRGAQIAARPADTDTIAKVFTAAIATLHAELSAQGRHLCIRSHPHSQFHTGASIRPRPSTHSLLARAAPVRAVLTVRHPLDSFVSLRRARWVHFEPDTPEAYAQRYLAFLDAHQDIEILTYERFVTEPEASAQWLCERLALSYDPAFPERMQQVWLSGNSGRAGARITPRERRPIAQDVLDAARASQAFRDLCERLDYTLERREIERSRG